MLLLMMVKIYKNLSILTIESSQKEINQVNQQKIEKYIGLLINKYNKLNYTKLKKDLKLLKKFIISLKNDLLNKKKWLNTFLNPKANQKESTEIQKHLKNMITIILNKLHILYMFSIKNKENSIENKKRQKQLYIKAKKQYLSFIKSFLQKSGKTYKSYSQRIIDNNTQCNKNKIIKIVQKIKFLKTKLKS